MRVTILDNNTAVAHTRVVPAVLQFLRGVEGRRKWVKGGLRFMPTGHNLSLLEELVGGLNIIDQRELVAFIGEGPEPNTPENVLAYKSGTDPFDHQVKFEKWSASKVVIALFAEQGTGKTKMLIDWCGKLFCARKITAVLVVTLKGVHEQWITEEVPKHLGIDFFGQSWVSGKKVKTPFKRNPKRLEWFSINYDAIKFAGGMKAAQSFLDTHYGKVAIIFDESHSVKDQRTARWKACKKLADQLTYKAEATGTPIAKDLTEEWAQLNLIDESIIGIKYLTTFRNKYCIMGGFEGRQVIGTRNLAEFKEKTEPHVFRVTKDELGILPKQYTPWRFQLTDQQKEMVRTMKRAMIAQLKSGEITQAQVPATSWLRIQQICSGFIVDEDQNVHSIFDKVDDNPRIQAMVEYLDSKPGKAIIWARFRPDIEFIRQVLGNRCMTYHGGTSPADRLKAKESFLDPEGIEYFVSNSAGSTGLNLQGLCNQALYYSHSDNSIFRWQSEDRIHRIGTKGICEFTDLIGIGSTDPKTLLNLRRKKQLSQMVLDDVVDWLESTDSDDLFELTQSYKATNKSMVDDWTQMFGNMSDEDAAAYFNQMTTQ